MTASELAEALAAARSRYSLLRRLLPTPEGRGVLLGLSLGEDSAEEVIARARKRAELRVEEAKKQAEKAAP